MASPFLSCQRLLQRLDLLFPTSVVAWMLDGFPIRQGCQMQHTQINPNIDVARREFGHGLYLTGEHDIPLPCFILDGAGFGLALQLAMHYTLDGANLGEDDMPVFETVATLGIGEAGVTVSPLEARIAWLFTVLHAPKERSKRFV